ncbi:MAG: ribonuclease R [Gammaproteobacteria bacterium]|nr:ribonuclease R [Gammaproteobacteria bacterium]
MAGRPKSSNKPRPKPTSKRYQHAVPDAGTILKTLGERGSPMTIGQLARQLDVRGEQPVAALKKRLGRMSTAGQLLVNRRGEYCLLEKIDALPGVVMAHPDGFGFMRPDDGSDDIYLPYHEMRALLDGDRVAVHLAGRGRGDRRQGAVVEILERGKSILVGQYHREHGVGYVREAAARSPHNFMVPDHYRAGAKHGQMVKLKITDYPAAQREAHGKIVQVLGEPSDPGMATTLAIESFGLPAEWPAAVVKDAAALGDQVRSADKVDRVDLRKLPLVTIDGADARDFDDAVFAEPDGTDWRLIVAIADVSEYVKPADPIDHEARLRGTSVYFPDRVVPMLPESLSNGLCSLNPKVDRLCLACDMRVSANGKVLKSKFYRAVMRSKARLTYNQVHASIGERDQAARRKFSTLLPALENLYGVYRALTRARRRRGALELELPEVRIEVDERGQIKSIAPRHRNDAHRLIEECMIAANVQAAKSLRQHRLSTLYRVHAGPEAEKFEDLRLLLQELGLKVSDQALTQPREMNKILLALRERPDFQILAVAVLRTMSQAVYQPGHAGHFGLGLASYAHFTSPIRRYPDLLVHRGIKHILDKKKPAAFAYDQQRMEGLGRDCSALERRAEDAARHVEARFKCAYIQDKVGQEFEGVVTGVTHFGLFVMLQELFVEGLVHVSSLSNDYYHLEHGGLRLAGERSGRGYGLGDQVKVRLIRVDVDDAKVDLSLLDQATVNKSRGRTGRRGSGRRRGSR